MGPHARTLPPTGRAICSLAFGPLAAQGLLELLLLLQQGRKSGHACPLVAILGACQWEPGSRARMGWMLSHGRKAPSTAEDSVLISFWPTELLESLFNHSEIFRNWTRSVFLLKLSLLGMSEPSEAQRTFY